MTPIDKKEFSDFLGTDADLQKWKLKLLSKLWFVALFTLVGALMGAVIYLAWCKIANGETKYQVATDYYITFNEQEYPNGMDYYNAYTWSEFIKDDHIVEPALESLPEEIDRDCLMSYVSTQMLGDYRLLTVLATGTEPGYAKAISQAYEQALVDFAGYIPEILSIEVWSEGEVTTINENTKLPNAAILGAVIGLVLSAIALALWCAFDDRIYTQADVAGYLPGVTFIGYSGDLFGAELEANLKKLDPEGKAERMSAASNLAAVGSRCILEIPMGGIKATQLVRRIDFLKTQECEIIGVIITRCDDKFLKRYYR